MIRGSPLGNGCALLDLAFPSAANFAKDSPFIGRLAGVMFELRRGRKVMVAVRIEHIIYAIRNFSDDGRN